MTIAEIQMSHSKSKLMREREMLLIELHKHNPLMAEVEREALTIEASNKDDIEKNRLYEDLVPKVNQYHEATADIRAVIREIDARLVFLEETWDS